MQPSKAVPVKLNRNAFKLDQGLVPKRRRLSRSPEGTDPAVCSTESPAPCTPGPRIREYDQETPGSDTTPTPCTLRDRNNNDHHHHHQQQHYNNTLRRKQIRCHVHLALRFRGGETSVTHAEAQPSVSCTVSRYVTGDVRGKATNSRGDAIEPNAGSTGKLVSNQDASRSGAPGKKDGPAACLGSNFNRNAGLRKHFGSISRLGSERQVKRSVKNACCALCGDVKYTSPTPKKLASACKAGSRSPGQPGNLKQSVVHPVAQAKTPRLVIWLRRHLTVKLCDVAHVFDVTSRDFSCILPTGLLQKRKHKKVKCFSKEFRSLMRLDSKGSGNCGKWIGNQSWEVCTPTNSSASLSSGNQVLGFSVGDHILDIAEDIEKWSESADKKALRMPDCERIRSSTTDGTACVPSKPGKVQQFVESTDYQAEGSIVAFEVQEVKTAPVRRVPSLFLRRVHACGSIASSQLFQHANLADKFIVSEADTNDKCLVEKNMNASPEGEVDVPDSSSCQRTTAYIVRPRLSCARTYRSWPFPRNGPPCDMMSLIRSGPRWIVTTDANMRTDFKTSSECRMEKNMKETLIGFGSNDEGVQAQTTHGQVQSTLQTERELAFSALEESSEERPEGQKKSGNALTSVNMDISSSEVMNSNEPKLFPVALISTVDTKSVDFIDSSINKAQSSMSKQHLEDDENGTEASTFHFPDSLPDVQQCAFQTSHIEKNSSEEPRTPTVMVPSSLEPKHPSSEVQKCNTDFEESLNILHTETNNQSTSFTNCTRGSTQYALLENSTNRDFLSSVNEDFSSMSPAERSEEDAEEDEVCEKAKSPSPLPASEGTVFTGGDLDVMRAYKDDAIVLDVIHDDPDLFGAVVMSMAEPSAPKATLRMGKNTCMQIDQTSLVKRQAWGLESKRDNIQSGGDVHVESNDGFCKGEMNASVKVYKSQPTFSTKWPRVTPVLQQEQMVPPCNKKQTTDLYLNRVIPGWTGLEGDANNNVHTAAGKDVNIVRPLPPSYCKFYFSENHICLRTPCWFLHVPREDDEKFCMDIVKKFCYVGTPPLVLRAEEIFTAYYRTCSPGVTFSENIVNQLLSSLLSLSLLKDLVSVINTLLTHKRMPSPEFVVALYEHVQERRILNFVPDLIHLTSKITEAGCVFSVEQCEMMQLHLDYLQVSRHLMDIFCEVKCRALATNPHTAEPSELGQAAVRVELCKQQEDWAALARVFCTVCGGRHSAGELSRFCCCVTTALLTESRDKLTLPYEPFAESVCQEVPADEMIKSFLGRVGVSLMFSYHRTQDWTKGLRLLCVMSRLQIEFTMLKGLFSSENGVSRCQIVTTATEFFLNSGSIEGALNMLKANEWFVSSSAWPCDQTDIQNRRRVLTLLAEKTSYRDTLEVLTNLPGLKQPVDGAQASEYSTMFNAHLRRCVINRVLPVGADTLEFMLNRGIPPDKTELQQLIHKLGKQNSWSRARNLFRCAHSAGYYSGVVCDKDSLALPCSLTEIEMTLAFEMFIACICTSLQNPSDFSRPLLITLKRCSGHEVAVESVYLAAGCRLLSAALIPNPKLSIRYNAVSQEQEQLFNLDRSSAAKWFSHNRSWAQGLWANTCTHSPQQKTPFINGNADSMNISSL